jgi:hypothetical protein
VRTSQRERSAEAKLRDGVKKRLGGLALKLTPTVSGIPDRLAILPGGKVVFIELKRESGGVVSEIQKVQHDRLRAKGHDVVVLRGTKEVEAWLAEMEEEMS